MGSVIKFTPTQAGKFSSEDLAAIRDWTYNIFNSFSMSDISDHHDTTDEGEDWIAFSHDITGAIFHTVFFENGKVILSSDFTKEDLAHRNVTELMNAHANPEICKKWGYQDVV